VAFPTGKATCIVTLEDAPAAAAECLPAVSDDLWFEVRDWSPDGRWLVGNQSLRAGAMVPEVLLWSIQAQEYRPVETRGFVSRWLPDSQNLLLLDERPGLVTVDREAGAVRFVTPLDFDGVVDQKSLGLSRDGRTVVVQSDVSESNLWLLSFPELSEEPL
jgi:hypothetical protein